MPAELRRVKDHSLKARSNAPGVKSLGWHTRLRGRDQRAALASRDSATSEKSPTGSDPEVRLCRLVDSTRFVGRWRGFRLRVRGSLSGGKLCRKVRRGQGGAGDTLSVPAESADPRDSDGEWLMAAGEWSDPSATRPLTLTQRARWLAHFLEVHSWNSRAIISMTRERRLR